MHDHRGIARRLGKAGLLWPQEEGVGLVSLSLVSAMPITLSQHPGFSSLLPTQPSGVALWSPVNIAVSAQMP